AAELETACNPASDLPCADDAACVVVEDAAVAGEEAASICCDEFTEWGYPVLERQADNGLWRRRRAAVRSKPECSAECAAGESSVALIAERAAPRSAPNFARAWSRAR